MAHLLPHPKSERCGAAFSKRQQPVVVVKEEKKDGSSVAA